MEFRALETDFEKRKKEILTQLQTRALKTEKDYQKEIDKLLTEAQEHIELNLKYEKLKEKASEDYNKYNNLAVSEYKKSNKLENDASNLWGEAKKKGFKCKWKDLKYRAEELEFEIRVLNTEKDYQQEINEIKALITDYKEENIRAEQEVKKYKDAIGKYEKFMREYINAIDKWNNTIKLNKEEIARQSKRLDKVYKEGKSKGFKNLKI